LFFNNNYVVIL